jgi:peroxiredoxin
MILVCFVIGTGLNAQGYTIDFAIKGEKNKDVLLGMYYGSAKYSIDTAQLNKKGKAVFNGNKPLAPGMYLIAIDGTQLCDFLISDTVNQTFSIAMTKGKYLETLQFKNSPENEAFADYTRFLLSRQKRETELSSNLSSGDKSMKSIDDEIRSWAQQTDAKVDEIKTKFPGSLLIPVAMAMNFKHPDKSSIPLSNDSARRYLADFYKNHYWDRLCLTDKRMQNTPIIMPALDSYLKNMVVPMPDSIIRAVDMILSRAESDSLMLKFLATHIFNNYMTMTSKIMGMEGVVVHLIDNYYLPGRVSSDSAFILKITEYAEKIRPTLIGKQAKELKMETISGVSESLYDIDAPYIVVCFYESSCDHCRKEIPQIYKVFQSFKDRGVAGFCVYTQKNKDEWMKFVSENQMTDWINAWDPRNENGYRTAYSVYSVPQVYVLDRNHKIVGRGLESISLAQLLGHLTKKLEPKEQ